MQLVTSRTISPQANIRFLQSDFSKITFRLEQKYHSASLHPFVNFQGQISIADYLFPVQKFSLKEKDNFVFIENFPTDSFPKIEIILEKKSVLKVKKFNIQPSDNSVQGEILYTRFVLLIADTKKCSLHFKDIVFEPFNFGFSEIPSQDKKQLLYRAKLHRKLRFIEKVFEKNRFIVPQNIAPNEAQHVEILFRGLTEGEFINPSDSFITIYNYKITKDDLQNNFLFTKREFSLEFNEKFFVLGRFFDVGKIAIKVKNACIANPKVVKNVTENEVIEVLRLNVYNSQIQYVFEKYKGRERLSKNKQKLERFKDSLAREEPAFLTTLLDEPLAEVNEKSAIEILEALLQYYDFPDRFSVLKPKLERNRWKVPIALTYPKYEPIFLTNAFVDVKTGKVEMKISFDELLKKGKKKAKEVFSIA